MFTNNMKWKPILQNLMYFMQDLLPASYSHGNWTKDNVDRAISWAHYCENISKQISLQQGILHESLFHIKEKYHWILSFQQLLNAKTYLFRFLLQNQLLSKDIKLYVNQKAHEALGAATVDELCKEALQQLDSQKHLMDLFKKNEKIYLRFQTRLMLEAGDGLSSEQLSAKLKHVITSPGGVEVLIEAMTYQAPVRAPNRSLALAMKWLEDIFQAGRGTLYSCVLTQLSTVPSSTLCQLLTVNQTLHSVLLLALKREANKLKPCYGDDSCTWVPLDSSGCLIEFKCLVAICAALVSDPNVASWTQEKLSVWCLEDGGMIWNDVLKDLEKENRL